MEETIRHINEVLDELEIGNLISTYQNINLPQVIKNIEINKWFSLIKYSEHSNLILKVRKGEYDKDYIKTVLPVVTLNFIYKDYKLDINIKKSTGLMYFDIDDINFNINSIDNKKVFSYWRSVGGEGYAILVKVDNITKENFKYNHRLISEDLGIKEYVDKNTIKASQFTILSYDPNIYINNNSKIYIANNDIQEEKNALHRTLNKEKKKEERKDIVFDVVHFSNPIRFDNLQDVDFNGEDCFVNWDGIEYVSCFLPYNNKIKKGNRQGFFLAYLTNLVYLNPHITKERALKVLKTVNEVSLEESVEDYRLDNVIKTVFKQNEEDRLQPKFNIKKRKIVINNSLKLSKEEKFGIVHRELAIKKRNESQQKIYNIIEQWDFNNNGKITQNKIVNNNKIARVTVQKYWSGFKDYVTQLNNK